MIFVRAILILIAAGLIGGGVYFLLDPPPGEEGIVQYLPGGIMFLFAVLIFAIFLPMTRGLGHGRLLRTGEPASATVVEVRDANITVGQQPIFQFALDVRRSDGSTYRATVRQPVARPAIGSIRPGVVVPVRVDPRRPHKVAIDSQAGAAPAATGSTGGGGGDPAAAALAWAAGAIPTSQTMSVADLLRHGTRGTATLRSASLTGRTVGDVQRGPADPATASDPMVLLVMDLTTAEGRTVTAQGVHRVPGEQLPRLAPGLSLPVAYLPANPASTTCVDWEQLARNQPGVS